MPRYIVVSESRGVYLGGFNWSKGSKTPLKNVRVPCWSPERIALVLKDLGECHGLSDLRSVECEGLPGRRNLDYQTVLKTGAYGPVLETSDA